MPSYKSSYKHPRLLADIGGTYARFALEVAPGEVEHVASLRCAEHADFHAALSSYLATLPEHPSGHIEHAAVAIANPVAGDAVRMTNYHWEFSIEQMRQRMGFEQLVVVNDFTALAMALPRLAANQRRQVGGGRIRPRSVVGLIGAGSGLGVSGLIPADDGWVALGTEGGHTSFSPRDEREVAILQFAWKLFPHVSFERLLSGPGLELIHAALAQRMGIALDKDKPLTAPDITRRGLAATDDLCVETLDAFCAILGTAAANLAVTQGAFGGIYIGGGIVPRLGAYFDRSLFRERFEDKGRFSDYCKSIPTFVITAENATFLGVSAILSQQVRGLESSQGSALLGQIQRARANLSPAEKRVADYVLSHPRSAMNDPIAQIALAADVSQPTVIRFCRTLGCEGLSDFKLRMASGLTGTVPLTHTQVTGDDSMLELGVKVLGNTASAILQVRDHLNRETIDRAIDLLNAATRVEFYGTGQYGVLAQDAQFKFLRLGVPCMAYTDARLQQLASNVVEPGVVVVIVSSSGRVGDLITVADLARARGAQVVAITASHTPLARKADIALIVDHTEDVATQLPMIGRILYLLMIDILAVGVAMRRGSSAEMALSNEALLALDDAALASPVAGSSAVAEPAHAPFAHLTTHSRRVPTT
jgi:glucokinase